MAFTSQKKEVTGWVGWVYFAGLLLLFAGIFQLVNGFTALLNDTFFLVREENLVVFDFTTWGWVHLLLGLFLVCTGVALFSGNGWARVVAIVLVSLNFVAQFVFLSAYPIWSVIVMIIDLLILYALTVHGDEAKD